MTDQRHCPTCGAPLTDGAPLDQCARCLLQLALAADESDTASSASMPRQFGDYELLGEIARGGMGVVYKARQRSLDRIVALKIILSGTLASEAERKRFRSEAESSAELDHPNIVPIYQVGEQDGQPFLTMKFIDGESLALRLRDVALPSHRVAASTAARPQAAEGPVAVPSKFSIRKSQTRVAALMSKIARAVHFAHQRAIIHRDLKPANILLDSRGEPHITDFGLAKRLTADAHLSTVDPQLTLTGSILGSPSYIAPEQASGVSKRLSTAADIYSLGVILYQLLTRELPFQGASPLDTLRKAIECDPDRPRVHNPAIDRDLETICLKCLEKDPQRRYGSAEAFADDLDRWLRREPIAAVPATAWTRTIKWIRRKPLHASLLAVTAVAIAGPFIVANVYRKTLPHMATEHPVVTPNRDGIYTLPLYGRFKEDRCTDNFWRGPFERTNRLVRLEITNVPAEMIPTLRCLVRADIAGQPDPARTPTLTNGQLFSLKVQSKLDRDFYVASVGWHASNILAQASNATVRLILLP